MEIVVKTASFEDIHHILSEFSLSKQSCKNLLAHRNLYYDEAGKGRAVMSFVPETVLVARSQDRVVGYLLFLTERADWDNRVCIELQVIPGTCTQKTREVFNALSKACGPQKAT